VTARPAGILPLSLEEVSLTVGGERLIDRMSVRIEAGGPTIVLGPNGAGKSLFLRLAHGLIRPSEGRIVWQGPAAASPGRYQAMVFQRPVLLRRSALGNVLYALRVRGRSRAEATARADEVLARTGLAAIAHRPARALSGGEQQRLALARAWALEPEVLFLDEPTANLDPSATAAVERLVEAISTGGTKIVMTTHDLGQARRLADSVLFMHSGRIVERGAAEAFFAAPETPEAAAFLRGELTW
jgi:tungstate transport system ATP-binding protein